MDMVVPRDEEKSFILRGAHITSCDISIKNQVQDIYTGMGRMKQMSTGSTVEVELSITAKTMDAIDEPYEIAVVREKRVRDCTLGELILAIAGKSE